MYPPFSVTKILSSETAIARGLSRFLAKILTESLSEFEVDNGNGNGIVVSMSEVKTKKENITTAIIAMIRIFLYKKRLSFQILLIAFKNLIKRIYGWFFFIDQRGGEVRSSRRAHNPQISGSNLLPAT